MRPPVMLIFLFFLCVPCVLADSIELNNGQKIEGRLVSRGERQIQLDFNGVRLTFWMDEVAKINNDPVVRDIPVDTARGGSSQDMNKDHAISQNISVAGKSSKELFLEAREQFVPISKEHALMFETGDLDAMMLQASLQFNRKSDDFILGKFAGISHKEAPPDEKDFVAVFNDILNSQDFYIKANAEVYKMSLPHEAQKLIAKARGSDNALGASEYRALNMALLTAIYSMETRKVRVKEMARVNEIIRNGWRDGVDATFLDGNLKALSSFKEALTFVPGGDDLMADFSRTEGSLNFSAVNELYSLFTLLLVEAERAGFAGDNALFETDIISAVRYLYFLTREKSGKSLALSMECVAYEDFFIVFQRHVAKTKLSRDFLRSIAESLKQVIDSQPSLVAILNDDGAMQKERFLEMSGRAPDVNALREVIAKRGYSPSMIPDGNESLSKEFWDMVYKMIDGKIDRWVLSAQDSIRTGTEGQFDRSTMDSFRNLLNDLKSKNYQEPREQVIDFLGYTSFINQTPFVLVKETMLDYFISEVKVTYLAVLEKLFEMGNDHPVASLAELVPQYIDVLPKDDFSGGKDFSFYADDRGKRICGVGVDKKDDQGRKLTTFEMFQNKDFKGDICFVF